MCNILFVFLSLVKNERGEIMICKKIIALFLSVILCLSFSVSSIAALPDEPIITPLYNTIDGIAPSITKNGSDLIARVSVGTLKTCSIEVTMAVQRSTYGTSWANYASFSKVTLNSGTYRTTSKTVEDVPTGFYYRTYAIVNVYVNGTLTDSDIVESDPVYVS